MKQRMDDETRAERFLSRYVRTPADWDKIRHQLSLSNDRHDKITLRVGDKKYGENTN